MKIEWRKRVNRFVGRKSRLIFSLPPKHTDLLIVTKIEGKKTPTNATFNRRKNLVKYLLFDFNDTGVFFNPSKIINGVCYVINLMIMNLGKTVDRDQRLNLHSLGDFDIVRNKVSHMHVLFSQVKTL